MLQKAKRILDDAGIKPKPVPPKVLFPLLEYASLEDEDNLQSMWAALLASAADPSSSVTVVPSLVEVLKQLSPGEARLLSALYSQVLAFTSRTQLKADASLMRNHHLVEGFGYNTLGMVYAELGLTSIPWAMTVGDFRRYGEAVGVQKSQFAAMIDDLVRLELLTKERDVEFDKRTYERDFAQLPKSLRYKEKSFLSSLGFELVTACRGPGSNA